MFMTPKSISPVNPLLPSFKPQDTSHELQHVRQNQPTTQLIPPFDNLSLKAQEILKQFPLTSNHLESITKFQAHVRGKLARNITILPNQMNHRLQELQEFPLREDCTNHSILFCRLMNEMMRDKSYRDKTITINGSTSATYQLSDDPTVTLINKARSQASTFKLIFKTNHDSRIELSQDGKSIRLLILPKSTSNPTTNLILGKGTYKKVYALHELTFATSVKNGVRPCIYRPQVLQRTDISRDPKKPNEGIKTFEVINHTVTSGLKALEKIVSMSAEAAAKLLPLPRRLISVNQSREDLIIDAALEYTQPWCNSDLSRAITSKTIPLSFKPTDKNKFRLTLFHVISIFQDVAEQLKHIHEQNHVHSDVKPANILISASLTTDRKVTVKGYLSDYDMASEIGDEIESTNYPYWDSIARGFLVATPFNDCYGLAVSIFVTFLPQFSSRGFLRYLLIENYFEHLTSAIRLKDTKPQAWASFLAEKEAMFKDIQKLCNQAHLRLVQDVLTEFEELHLENDVLANPNYEKLNNALELFCKEPSEFFEEDLEILKNLKNDLFLQHSLLSFAIKILNQDLARIETLLQCIAENMDDVTHWSHPLVKNEDLTIYLKPLLKTLDALPTVSAQDINLELNRLKEIYLKNSNRSKRRPIGTF